MHPMIFMKENLPAYEKIQNNWLYQYLDEKKKKQILQMRHPKYIPPGKENYIDYVDEIISYANWHKDEVSS